MIDLGANQEGVRELVGKPGVAKELLGAGHRLSRLFHPPGQDVELAHFPEDDAFHRRVTHFLHDPERLLEPGFRLRSASLCAIQVAQVVEDDAFEAAKAGLARGREAGLEHGARLGSCRLVVDQERTEAVEQNAFGAAVPDLATDRERRLELRARVTDLTEHLLQSAQAPEEDAFAAAIPY